MSPRVPSRGRAAGGLSGALPTSRPKRAPRVGKPARSLSLSDSRPAKRKMAPASGKGLASKLLGGESLSRRLTSPGGASVKVEDLESGRGLKPVAEQVLESAESSLLDVVDNLLSQGVVLNGEAVIGVADVDLVYLRLSAVLAAADRVLGPGKKS